MHTRRTSRWSARPLTWLLALAAGTSAFVFGSVKRASAGSSLVACETKKGNDGHSYNWAAPC